MMLDKSYIVFNDGSKFAVENFKLLSAKNNEQELIDDEGHSFNIFVPETLKVKFEINLHEKNCTDVLSKLSEGINFTAVNYDLDEYTSGTGYCNCQICLINQDADSGKAYVLCNWPYTESNIQSVA